MGSPTCASCSRTTSASCCRPEETRRARPGLLAQRLRPFRPGQRRSSPLLDDLGLVVEGVEEVGEGLSEVVVARVTEIAAIPGADRIRRVTVDAGGSEVQVVCGAWNFEEGDLVPLAPVGTVLPGGMEIGRRKMKGVTSEGMLCSGKGARPLRRRGGAPRLGNGGPRGRAGHT